MAHVVVVPFPAQGHITPLMELSTKLAREEGFTITFVNTTHNHERLLGSGNTDWLPPNIRLAAVPDGLPRDHPRLASVVELCKAVTTSMASSLIEFLLSGGDEDGKGRSELPFTCLVCDVALPFGQKVADACNLPRVAFWTKSANYFAAVQLFCKGIWPPKSAEPVNKSVTSDLSSHIQGALPIKPSDMNALLLHGDPSDFMFDFLISPIAGVGKAAWILFNTFTELEAPVVHAIAKDLKITTIGPMLPGEFLSNPSHLRSTSALWKEEHDCLEWLDKKPAKSVLYISFGSITTLSEKQIYEFSLGLESSKLSFLWVIRPDLISGSLTKFLEGFLDSMEEGRALCVGWAPQLRVLSHAAVGGFLTHGGWNSVAEAIAAGVPMLGWPYFSDQKANCRCMVDGWKVGLHLEEKEDGLVTKEEVEEKVHLLMDGVELRERARCLRDATRSALSHGGSSHRNWDAFVQGIKLMEPSTSSKSEHL